jgi:GTP cyclohydrolase II
MILRPITPPALVQHIGESLLPTRHSPAPLKAHAFLSLADGVEHLALVSGEPGDPALVRMHSECLTGDVLGSLRCDCGEQLHEALARICGPEGGVLIYLRRHEGRGIGLANKIRAYALQDEGADTVEANHRLGFEDDLRSYDVAAAMLTWLGIGRVRLLTNNPRKIAALQAAGLTVAARAPLEIAPNPHSRRYLTTKKRRLGHVLALDGSEGH